MTSSWIGVIPCGGVTGGATEDALRRMHRGPGLSQRLVHVRFAPRSGHPGRCCRPCLRLDSSSKSYHRAHAAGSLRLGGTVYSVRIADRSQSTVASVRARTIQHHAVRVLLPLGLCHRTVMAAPSCKLECDLVMRGGITSGIVYPKAIAKLAETYRFRSIGGTSAGAIAAASTAAAAYGARETDQDPFQTLKNLPEELATEKDGKTVLERLFQPDPGMEPLFRVLMASLQGGGPIGDSFRSAGRFTATIGLRPFLGMTISAIPIALSLSLVGSSFISFTWPEWMVLVLILFSALPIAFALGLCATILGVWRNIVKLVPANSYGLCSGSGSKDSAGIAPLTDWLHELFQSLAGRELDDNPLTFGDLWVSWGRARGTGHRSRLDDDKRDPRGVPSFPIS